MTEKQLKRLKRKILDYFRAKRLQEIKFHHLVDDLNLRNKEISSAKSILEDFLRDQLIILSKGGKYQLNTENSKEISGIIQVTKAGPGFVQSSESKEEIFIHPKNLANALNGDTVLLEITHDGKRGKEGKIISVQKRAKDKFVGTLQKQKDFAFVLPDDNKIHQDFFIPGKYIGNAKNGQKVLVELAEWTADSRRPEAKIIEIIGFPGDKGVDVASVYKEFNIQDEFPSQVQEEANRFDNRLDPHEISKRLDLRSQVIFTIDPIDAKDFDDAVSLAEDSHGNLVLGVHIADVSHFVQEKSELDKEAIKRGCSVYLVDRVIPMLPEHLSNLLCSLRPNEEKYTYSAIMIFNATSLEMIDYQIKKTLIRSCRRFTYEEVQDILEKKKSDPLEEELFKMNALAKRFREMRFAKGSIDFHTPEVRFILDDEGKPTGIVKKKQLDSMKLIEEFMLKANQCVAKHIKRISHVNDSDYVSVYRIHDKPSQQKLAFLQSFMKGMGIELKLPKQLTPKSFQELMGPYLAAENGDLISDVAVRSMMKAAYATQNIGHFGLGFEDYSHFTSPIRRYPDLILHRLLFEYDSEFGKKRIKHYKKILPEICELSSANERNAEKAERESVRLKQVEFMTQHLNSAFYGKISGITDFGIYVEIEEFLIEGMIRLKSMTDDHYLYDADKIQVIGKRSGKIYHLGQRVLIEVVNVNTSARTIDFSFLKL